MNKWIVAVLGVGVMLMGCSKDSGKNNGSAAQVPANCMQTGGQGCSWPSYSQYYQQYPTYNGTYYGYNNGTYQNTNGCSSWGNSYYPVYRTNYGLACMYFFPGNYNYYMNQSYQQAYYYCNINDWNSCPAGTRCVSTYGAEGLCTY